MITQLVEILVDNEFREYVPAERLRSAALATLTLQNWHSHCELAIVVSGDAAIQELNSHYLGIDSPTDVLAFPTDERGTVVAAPGQPSHLGDIAISYPRARAQASELGHSVDDELQLLVVHGVLHLLGHDDQSPGKRYRMWAAQAEVLASLAVSPDIAGDAG